LFTGVTFLKIENFIVKIGCQNTKSLKLFKKLGFIEVLQATFTLHIQWQSFEIQLVLYTRFDAKFYLNAIFFAGS